MPDSILPLTEIVSPADQAAAAEVLSAAFEVGTAIYPLGGKTNLGYGANVSAGGEDGGLLPGLGISTEKLNRVVDHAHRDMTVTVESGVTLAKLAKLLAAKNQRLPVDVPRATHATVGGAVACNLAGPRRFRYGTMRDYVLGFQAIDGTGKPFAAGGRVVKNAAGYDMCRLITGSLGTLGLITQVTLMVRPLARRNAFLSCELPDFDKVERMLADLITSETLPAAVELLAGPLWSDDAALGPLDDTVARLLVAFEGGAADVEWMTDSLLRQWQHATGRQPTVVNKSQVEPLWHRLIEFPAVEDADTNRTLVVEIGLSPSRLVGLVQQIRQLVPTASIQAHAGDGVVRARLPIETDGDQQTGVVKLLEKLRPAVAACDGRLVVTAYPPQVKLDQKTVWGPAADRSVDGSINGVGMMRTIKERFDPKGILNPGRFIF